MENPPSEKGLHRNKSYHFAPVAICDCIVHVSTSARQVSVRAKNDFGLPRSAKEKNGQAGGAPLYGVRRCGSCEV